MDENHLLKMAQIKYIENKHCPFCGSEEISKYKKRIDDLWVLICGECELGFIEKYPEDLQQLYNLEYYEKDERSNYLVGYENYNDIKYDYFIWAIALVALTKVKGSIFDLGCSNGLFLDLAKIYGFQELSGVELNSEYAEICKGKGYQVYSEDFLKIQFAANQKYDIVTAWAVLEHIPQLNQTLEKIKGVLKPDGLLFFEVPCLSYEDRDQYWLESSLEHIYYFTEKSFRKIISTIFEGQDYIGRVVCNQQFGATLIGFVSLSQKKNDSLRQINNYLKWITRKELEDIPAEDLVNYLIFYLRYLEDFKTPQYIASYLNKQSQNNTSVKNYFVSFLAERYIKNYLDNLTYLEAKTYFLSQIDYLQSQQKKTQTELEKTQTELEKTQTELEKTQAKLEKTQTRLQSAKETITAMKTSKFWRLRSQWFKLKNLLGLTNDDATIGLKALSNESDSPSHNSHTPKVQKIKREVIEQQLWERDKPLVSVIIPCFNYGQYIEEAIDSVLIQTFQDFEIIVVDDGSTELHTIEVLNKLNKPKTKVIRQTNKKLPAARNSGIKLAQGKYICCLDADDLLKPTYLEKCLVRMETENLNICYSWLQEFGDSNLVCSTRDFNLENLIHENCVIISAIFKRDIWERTGGYNEQMTEGYEDWDFWIAIAKAGGTGGKIDEPLFLYRKHGYSMIDAAQKKHEILYQKIRNNHQELYEGGAIRRINQNQYAVTNGYVNLLDRFQSNLPVAKNKVNILFALPWIATGGSETVLLQLIKYLKSQQFSVTICTTVKPSSEMGDNTEKYEQHTPEIYHLHNFIQKDEWKGFILYLIESRQINIIFIAGSSYVYSIMPDIKQKFPNIKIADQLFNEYGHIDNNRKYAEWIDTNIVANRVIQDVLLEKYGEAEQKTCVIVHGVDTQEEFNPVNIDEQEIITNGIISQDKFIVSYMGRFSEEKCPQTFLNIVNLLRDYEDMYFVMLGNGPEYDKVKLKISELGLKDKIYAPGFVDDNKPFLKVTDVLVIPSRIEGIPIILMEGLSLSVPVVASKVGGIPDVIIDKYNGFVCDPDNINEFVEKIKKIYLDKDLHNQLKANARTYAVNNLDVSRMNNEYTEALQSLVNDSKFNS